MQWYRRIRLPVVLTAGFVIGVAQTAYGYEMLCDRSDMQLSLTDQLDGMRSVDVDAQKLQGQTLILSTPPIEIRFDASVKTLQDASMALNKALGPNFSKAVSACQGITCYYHLNFGKADAPIVVAPTGSANSLLGLSTDKPTMLGPIPREKIIGFSSASGANWIWCALIDN